MWTWSGYFEFMADNLAIPACVSIFLWLLLCRHNRKCNDETKQRLANSLGLFLLVLSGFGLLATYSDEPASSRVSRILLVSSGCAIAALLGLVANRYSDNQSAGGWILIGIGTSLQILLLIGMLNLLGWMKIK